MVKVVGLYSVPENSDVSLVEVIIDKGYDAFDISDFTQKVDGLERLSWQAAFGEKYLDITGTQIIDHLNPSEKKEYTRLVFFIYLLDQNKPMQTPFGDIKLPLRTTIPDRIKDIIKYEDPE